MGFVYNLTKQGKERIYIFCTRSVTVSQFIENNVTMYGYSILNMQISALEAKQGHAWSVLGWEKIMNQREKTHFLPKTGMGKRQPQGSILLKTGFTHMQP